jgi:hypothetical protein
MLRDQNWDQGSTHPKRGETQCSLKLILGLQLSQGTLLIRRDMLSHQARKTITRSHKCLKVTRKQD